jgi:YbbR domain-containing protein
VNIQWLRDMLLENWGLKLVSLLCAFLIWLFVVGQEQREEHFKIRLMLSNTPDQLAVVSRVPEFINVRLVGPRSILNTVRSHMLSVSLDLTGMQEGTSSYEILPSRLGLPRGVEVADISPSVVTLQADRKARKMLRIKPRLSGTPATGFEVAEVRVAPEEIEIEGAERPLKAAREISTEIVDIANLEGNFLRTVALAPPDPSFRPTSSKSVRLEVLVREMKGERGFVQVTVRPPGPGWIVRPMTVSVRLKGNLTVLSRLSSKDISARVRWEGKTAPPGPVPVEVTAPPDTEFLSVLPAEVHLIPAAESTRGGE